jgi:hypothetical protein
MKKYASKPAAATTYGSMASMATFGGGVAVRTILQTGIPYVVTTGPLGVAAVAVGVTVAAVYCLLSD